MHGKVEGLAERKPEAELVKSNSIESGTLLVKDGLEVATDLDGGSIGQASVESNVKASLFKDSIGLCSFCRPCADVKVVSRDDDENSAGRSQYGAMPKTYRPLSYTEPRRTSILTSSRHWRAAPNLKSGGYFRTDWKTKPPFRNGRTSYSCQRSQKIFPFKKRKFFDQCTSPTSDGAFHTEKAFLIIWIFLI
ncbi:hypothetical protein OIU76_010109 [Salix suchowensis]|nr:hypothetical protein OIU76_010109 [Salix suchowensis]